MSSKHTIIMSHEEDVQYGFTAFYQKMQAFGIDRPILHLHNKYYLSVDLGATTVEPEAVRRLPVGWLYLDSQDATLVAIYAAKDQRD